MNDLKERCSINVEDARRRARAARPEGLSDADVDKMHADALPRMIGWLNASHPGFKSK